MLILTRSVGQAILIGKDIRIMVMQIRGSQVRLGIEAPPRLFILRGEKKMLSPIYDIEVNDDSLAPMIPKGSLIRVQKDTWDEIKEGNLVVFPRDGQNYLGRVYFQGKKMCLEPLKHGEEPLILAKKDIRRLERVIGVDF